MILSSGERAVWAAAFALAHGEACRKMGEGEEGWRRATDALHAAWLAVIDIRALRQKVKENRANGVHPKDAESPEGLKMLYAMLGEE
jgi:hypothetical protein